MFLVYLFISISLIFFSLSVFGFYRFPDVYTRLHSSTLSTTFGFIFFGLATILYSLLCKVNYSLIARIIIITFILLTTSPSIAHIISRTAHRNKIKPKEAIIDKLL